MELYICSLSWEGCTKQAYVLYYVPLQPPSGFLQWQRYRFGDEALWEPFSLCYPADWWALKHCLFQGSFCPALLVILHPAQSHCCGLLLLLLWDGIAQVCPFGAWLPGLHSWPSGTEWTGEEKPAPVIWFCREGRSPSPPLDYEYRVLILSSGGLSGGKPLFTPCDGWIGLWLVTIYGLDSSKSTGKVEARLQALCLFGCATSSSVWASKKALKSLTLLQVQLTAQSPAMGGIRQPSETPCPASLVGVAEAEPRLRALPKKAKTYFWHWNGFLFQASLGSSLVVYPRI